MTKTKEWIGLWGALAIFSIALFSFIFWGIATIAKNVSNTTIAERQFQVGCADSGGLPAKAYDVKNRGFWQDSDIIYMDIAPPSSKILCMKDGVLTSYLLDDNSTITIKKEDINGR